MYYYIFESAKNTSQKNLHEKIKDYLGFLGIAGETMTVSPARSVEELTQMGIEKKYSTIVAVGGDVLINKIASLIQGTEIVLGIIPIEASEQINKK
jgi:diacylglycerol kinase family enzyme